jgi:hypothetical protein
MSEFSTVSFDAKAQLGLEKKKKIEKYSEPMGRARRQYIQSLLRDRQRKVDEQVRTLKNTHDTEIQWQKDCTLVCRLEQQMEASKRQIDLKRTKRVVQKQQEHARQEQLMELREKRAECIEMDRIIESCEHPMHSQLFFDDTGKLYPCTRTEIIWGTQLRLGDHNSETYAFVL